MRGRKKALSYVVEKTAENIEDVEGQEVIILNADCRRRMPQRLDEMLKAKVPGIRTRIENVGPGHWCALRPRHRGDLLLR